MVQRWLHLHLLLALCWPLQHPASAAVPHKRAPQLRNGGTFSAAGTGASSERHGFVGAPYNGYTSEEYDCSVHDALYGQIHADLMRFAVRGIRESNIRLSHQACRDSSGLYTCVLIENGTVYLTSLKPRNLGALGHNTMAAGFLLELLEASLRYRLPNVEFALYTGDQPERLLQDARALGQDLVQLSYSRRAETPEVLIPFSGHFRCYQNDFDSMLATAEHYDWRAVPWEARKKVAVGRYNTFCPSNKGYYVDGRERSCAREWLGRVSKLYPNLLDSGAAGSEAQYIPMVNHSDYRYIISTDGWTASSKLEKYLLMGNTVLKQASPLVAYYYAAMSPWVHYVPFFEYSEGDIVETITWLQQHDDRARRIARNAKRFASLHLHRQARLCYYKELFTEMSKLYRYNVTCATRKMCVPALEELKYVGHWSGATCTVHQQLDEMYGSSIDKGSPHGKEYGSEQFFHGYSAATYDHWDEGAEASTRVGGHAAAAGA